MSDRTKMQKVGDALASAARAVHAWGNEHRKAAAVLIALAVGFVLGKVF